MKLKLLLALNKKPKIALLLIGFILLLFPVSVNSSYCFTDWAHRSKATEILCAPAIAIKPFLPQSWIETIENVSVPKKGALPVSDLLPMSIICGISCIVPILVLLVPFALYRIPVSVLTRSGKKQVNQQYRSAYKAFKERSKK